MAEIQAVADKESAALQELKEKLEDVLQPKFDDNWLRKRLNAQKWDVKKAEVMVRKTIEWRRVVGADTILETYKIPEVLEKYMTGGLIGYDKEGYPVHIDPTGRSDNKGLTYSVKTSDMMYTTIYLCEHVLRQCEEQSRKLGREIDQYVDIIDAEGFGKDHLFDGGATEYLTRLMEEHYPEIDKATYIINAPMMFKVAFKLMKPFLSDRSVKHTIFLGDNWKEELLKIIDADQLPVFYGGTRMDPGGDIYCKSVICYGGKVPESYFLNKEEILPSMAEGLKTLKIQSRSSMGVPVDIKEPNSVIKYVFATLKNDIGFGVRLKNGEEQDEQDMQEIKASQKYLCDRIPEEGFVECATPGTYVLLFDNSHSLMRSKTVSYFFKVENHDLPMENSLQ